MNKHNLFANVRFVLSRTSHPGNIGAAARAMKTMGFSDLRLVTPALYPDPRAEARATGALDVLNGAQVCASLDEALHGAALTAGFTARRRDTSPGDYTPREAMPELLARARTQPVALLFGNEKNGLANNELEKCQLRIFIPTNPDYTSLNLGSAVQVAAYEMRLALLGDTAVPGPEEEPLAAHEDLEGFYAHLERVLVRTGFLDPASPKRLMPRLRRLFGRARPRQDEANILRGILTEIEKSLR